MLYVELGACSAIKIEARLLGKMSIKGTISGLKE